MLIATFFIGVFVGIAAVCWVASWFANSKPKAVAQSGISTASVSMDPKTMTLDAYHARLMRDVITNLEGKA
jgi:hypothetical protein